MDTVLALALLGRDGLTFEIRKSNPGRRLSITFTNSKNVRVYIEKQLGETPTDVDISIITSAIKEANDKLYV